MRYLLLAASAAALALNCCGYSAKSLLPPHLRTVAIQPVENSTTRPGIADELSGILEDAFEQDRSLRTTALDNADLAVAIRITSYARNATAYEGSQEITAYEISVAAGIEAEDRIHSESFYKGNASVRVTYDPSSESEEEATTRVLEQLASEVVRLIITKW